VWNAPDLLAVAAGSNEVSVSLLAAQDEDHFTFTVPAGFQLSAINLLEYSSVSPSNISYLLMQEGTMLSAAPATFNQPGADPIAYTAFNANRVGDDLLPSMLPGSGIVSPLLAGDYAIWANETGPDSMFRLDLVLTSVPEPSASLLALGCLLAATQRRKRSSQP